MPTILFLYGGSWKRGSREDYAFAGRALAREGFLVAVADYRVYPTVRYPDFVHDAAKAVAWLTKNAQNYGGRNEGIHLMGHSAGAHIVAMVALDETYLETAGTSQAVLGPWVGLAGPYAFYPSEVRSVRDIFAAFEDDAARPIMFADSGAPPALLLHGGDDTTVYPTNSIELAERLRAFDVDASAHLYDGLGHAPIVAALTPPFDGFAPVLADSVAFLKSGTRP